MNSCQKLATIVKIKEILPIDGADRIVLAKMEDNAFQCVVPKDSLHAGDFGVYWAIDSIVDSTNPALSFMAARKNKVWNCRFKSTLSQGLLLPLDCINYWGNIILMQGDDVTEFTKTTKFVKEENLQNNVDSAGGYAGIIEKTDELNLLSFPRVFQELKDKNVTITLKCDGSSGTFLWDNGVFFACSRSLKQKPEADNVWNRLAKKYNLAGITQKTNTIIRGECAGPKIQDNKMGLKGEELFVFDVFDLNTQKYLNSADVENFCVAHNLVSSLLLYAGPCFDSMEKFIDFASKVTYPNGKPGEGIVIRSIGGEFSSELGKRLSVKIINPNY